MPAGHFIQNDIDTTPDENDKVCMEIGGRQTTVNRSDFVNGFLGGDPNPGGGSGGSGATAATVATIPDLLAISTTDLAAGTAVLVLGYDDYLLNGHPVGGGWFVWEPDSEVQTDGGVYFCPLDLQAEATEEQVPFSSVDSVNDYYSMAHDQIVFGSLTFDYNDQTETGTDWWLHGHGVAPFMRTATIPHHKPLIDHALGRLYGDYYTSRFAACINSNTNIGVQASRYSRINYSYCTGPGRWRRVLDRCVTPAMFGAHPQELDGTHDASFAICWALNYIRRNRDVHHLYYEHGPYEVYGFWGEVFSDIVQHGDGPGHEIVRYRGDQGGGEGGVIDTLKASYFGFRDGGYPSEFNLYRLLEIYQCLQVQGNFATEFGFHDGWVNGNAESNMYFLDDTGETEWTFSQVSQYLRESPWHGGFFITNQAARQYYTGTDEFGTDRVDTYMHWHCHNFGWRYTLGSCHAGAGAGFLHGTHIRVGPTVSGRSMYGGQGDIKGLFIEGYTRSSFASPYSGKWDGVFIKAVGDNPWAANASDPAAIAHRSDNRDSETDVAGADQRYGFHQWEGSGAVDFYDGRSQEVFKWSGENAVFNNWRVATPRHQQEPIALFSRDNAQDGAGNSVATSGPTANNLRVESRGWGGVTLLSDGLYGQIQQGEVNNVHIIETYAKPSMIAYSHDLTQADWTKTGLAGTPIVANQGTDEFSRAIVDKMVEDSSNSTHRVEQSITTVTGKAYAVDFEVLAASTRDAYLYMDGAGYIMFDVSAEEIGFSSTTWDYVGFEEVDTGIYRVFGVYTETAGGARTLHLGMSNGASAVADATYLGDGASFIIAGGLHARQHDYSASAMAGPNTVTTTLTGGLADDGETPFSYRGDISVRPRANIAELVCDPDPSGGLNIPQQRVNFRNCNVETQVTYLCTFEGATQATMVPTRVFFDECQFNNTTNRMFRTDGATDGLATTVDVEVVMRNCRFNMFNPATAGYGDNTLVVNNLSKIIMIFCADQNGRVSDWKATIAYTVVAAAPGAGQVLDTDVNSTGILIPTRLLYDPSAYGYYNVTPISADAIAAGPWTVAPEIVGGNYNEPYLRIVPTGSVASTEVLRFAVDASVAPPREL